MQFASVLTALLASAVQMPDTLDVAKVTDNRNTALTSSAPLRRVENSQLKKRGAISLDEALRSFAGVNVKDYGGLGGMKTVNIRSFGAQHTGIVYDGQLISNAQNGQVDIGRFNLDEVKAVRAEISGTSDIFRPARLASSAGVLSIESARPDFSKKGTSASAQLRHASFNTWNPHLRLEQRISDRWAATVWGNYIYSAGNYPFLLKNGDLVTRQKRLHSDVSSFNGEANIYGNPGSGELSFKLSYYDSVRGLPGSVVLYTQNPAQRLWDRDLRASALYRLDISEKWRIKAGAAYDSAWNRFVDYDPIHPEPVDDRYLQQEGTLWAAALYKPMPGLEFSLAQDMVLNTLDATIPGCPFPTRLSSYTALSGKYESGGISAVITLLGTAIGEWTRIGDAAPGRLHLSPSASISYRLPVDTELRLRASVKDSFRMPSFNDLYYSRTGNRKLKPERAWQTNLGIAWGHVFGTHSLSLTADGYWNAVKDRIVAVPSMFIWSMRNVGRVQMLGADLCASYKGAVFRWMEVEAGANYSYQYAVDITDASQKNYRHQIAYTPRHSGSGNLVISTPWIDLGYSFQAVGQRFSLAQNTAAYRLAPYTDHSLSLSHQFEIKMLRLDVSLQALNLGGQNYEVIKYYPMPGRQYRITIKITY